MTDLAAHVTFEQLEHRATVETVRAQARLAGDSPVVQALLEAVDTLLVVLNGDLQIVAANRKVLGDEDLQRVVGLRTGEAVGCVHASEGPGGCGTAPACTTCGALRTIRRCQLDRRTTEGECQISVGDGAETLEFHVRATPVPVEGEPLLVVSLRDVSAEKRREVLEQVFFHDVLNTLSGLLGWIRVLEKLEGPRSREVSERISALGLRVVREIRDQRALLLAESGQLELAPTDVRPSDLFEDLRVAFSHHPAARDRHLFFVLPQHDQPFSTDPAILFRVLANMVTNALEATPAHGQVEVRCDRVADGSTTFEVRNEAVMPRAVAHRVFQRSFTTKNGRGRGLGTYSMKMLGERQLGGRVWFESVAGRGTRFVIELPAP